MSSVPTLRMPRPRVFCWPRCRVILFVGIAVSVFPVFRSVSICSCVLLSMLVLISSAPPKNLYVRVMPPRKMMIVSMRTTVLLMGSSRAFLLVSVHVLERSCKRFAAARGFSAAGRAEKFCQPPPGARRVGGCPLRGDE